MRSGRHSRLRRVALVGCGVSVLVCAMLTGRLLQLGVSPDRWWLVIRRWIIPLGAEQRYPLLIRSYYDDSPQQTSFPYDTAVSTATSPWSPLGDDGWPVSMPEVDASVDIFPMVDEQLVAAKRALKAGEVSRALMHAQAALALDPIHDEAQAIRLRAAKQQIAQRSLRRKQYTNPREESDRYKTPAKAAQRLTKNLSLGQRKSRVLEEYTRGRIEVASRLADSYQSRAVSHVAKKRWERLSRLIEVAERRYIRIRSEIANSPTEARARLTAFEQLEQRILGKGVRSYLAEELRADLAVAFAREGGRFFVSQRYQAAFERWMAGLELSASNIQIRYGLEKLERVARAKVRTARLDQQRGRFSLACDGFQRVLGMTRPAVDIYKIAQQEYQKLCLR